VSGSGVALGLALMGILSLAGAPQAMAAPPGKWLAGDLHNHTFLTDGSHTQVEVVEKAFTRFGLDWLVNSEHGGAYTRNPAGVPFDTLTTPPCFLGDAKSVKGHRAMWRWQSLRDYAWPQLASLRARYPGKLLFQGLEWNVPGHEHASVGIIMPEGDAEAISEFEYIFDAEDTDSTGQALAKKNQTHADGLAGAAYLQGKFKGRSYVILNHPSRKLKYSIADFRDFHNTAPETALGFEGLPGHQKEPQRGGYDKGPFTDADGNDITYKARTYGGADYLAARVGGLWDALLGEGRQFWIVVNSDFHSAAADADFWPGEYGKTWVFVPDENGDGSYDYRELLAGLRSGKSFAVHGDLIGELDFTARQGAAAAEMGQTLRAAAGHPVEITIAFKSSASHRAGSAPRVDHLDLIAGEVTGTVDKFLPDGVTPNPAYHQDTNPTTRVIATFGPSNWTVDQDGRCIIRYRVQPAKGMYYRLRGTNLAANTPHETDAEGNPLRDELLGKNDASRAWADLWFYSNPIFVSVGQ